MKKIIVLFSCFLIVDQAVVAQAKTKKQPQKATSVKKPTTQENLNNTATYPAKGPAIPTSTLGWRNMPVNNSNSISDPVIRTLNGGTLSTENGMDFREFMGIGRGANGFKHCHITFKPNGSTTSGGITGSGSVGTGSSLGNVGVHGAAAGVNGKNLYAGPGMWGTTGTGIGTNFRMHDSSNRSIRLKKN